MDTIANRIESKSCEICGEHFLPDGRRKARCGEEHFRNCTVCGDSFAIKANDKSTKEFCSRDCSNKSRSRFSICPICGEEFTKRSKTCSTKCSVELRQATSESRASEKKCTDCSKLFESSNPSELYCQNQHYGICEVCGNSFESAPGNKRRTCSNLCAGKLVNSDESMLKRRETSRARYGTEFPQQSEEVKIKIAASNLERYGYSSPLGSPEIREKGQKTNFERYGASHYLQSKEGKIALEKTYLSRYGVKNIAQSDAVKAQIRETFMKKYGVDHPLKDALVLSRLQATNMERYGVPNVLMDPEIKAKASASFHQSLKDGSVKHPRISKINREYAAILEADLDVEVEFEAPVGSFFVDLKITHGAKTFYIDIHPTVSHNSEIPFGCLIGGCEEGCEKHSATKPTYHSLRAKAALDENKTLIQWYGWQTSEQLVALLRPKLQPAVKVSARKAIASALGGKDANSFMNLYHIQGTTRGQTFCYGLYVENQLIAVATFGKSRFGSKFEHEFIRYAVKPGFVVYGGAGKLVSMFMEESKSSSLVSYVDFDHTTAQSIFLLQVGFEEINSTGPGLIWHNPMDNRTVKGTSLLMQGADRLLGTNYGSREVCGLDNRGIMLAEGFLPVHTSGNRVFLLEV